jgi:hypothetical protein
MSDNNLPTVEAIQKQLATLSKASPALAIERLEQILKANPGLYARYVYEKRHGRPAPDDQTVAPLSYDDIVKAVQVRKAFDQSSMQDAWVKLLSDNPGWADAYRRWQTHEQPQYLAQAEIAANPITPLTKAQIKRIVEAMPDPPKSPSMDFMKMR